MFFFKWNIFKIRNVSRNIFKFHETFLGSSSLKVLLVVRVHQRGGFLHLGYEQCASRGLLVWSHVHGTSFMSGVNTCITRSTPSFSLADLGDTVR